MILFSSKYIEIKNTTIHYLLKHVKLENKNSFEDLVDTVMPKHLKREQFEKCENTFNNLLSWTNDKFYHILDSFSKLALYHFIKETNIYETLKDDKMYQKEIEKKLKSYKLEKKQIFKKLYNEEWYLEIFSNDKYLINFEKDLSNNKIEKYLKENPNLITIYQDILPNKIKKNFVPNNSLYQSINEFLKLLQEQIDKGDLANLFWVNESPASEREIQETLQCFIDAYFYKEEIDINRESQYGNGKIDFKFYKNSEEIVIIELKKASSSYLKQGYESQLIKYMKASHCKKAYYIVLVFNDKDMEKARNLIKSREDTEEYHEYIEILILDLRINKTVMINHNESTYKKIDKNLNNYFKIIYKINALSNHNEILLYLKTLKNNFEKIHNYEYKLEYIEKLHKLASDNKDYRLSFLDEDSFYNIYKEDSLRKIVLDIMSSIKNEKDFNKDIKNLINYIETLKHPCNPERITKEEIIEIYKLIKKKNNYIYNLLRKIKLNIYIINEESKEYNTCVIPSINCNEYKIVCTYMKEDSPTNSGYPIYTFIYNIGLILLWSLNKDYQDILQKFITAMRPYTNGLNTSSIDAQTLFADSFFMYLVNETKYNKNNPFKNVDRIIYDKLKLYFDNLLESEVSKDVNI